MRTFIQPLLRQLLPALVALAVFTVGLGIVYPVVVTGIGQVAFSDQADGSLVDRDGAIVGSELIGQPFVSPEYLHPRPSAAGAGYDGSASSGSNLGPSNPELLEAVVERVAAYRELNGLSDDVAVPVDAVTASASGLDPHISVANARLQARRIAEARGVAVGDVLGVIEGGTEEPVIGVLGEAGVDVLAVNLSLDDRFGRPD